MRPMTALALVSALTGCASAPRGPHAEYRAGVAPVAPPAARSDTYLLHSYGTTVAVREIEKGQPLGFVREKDGSVSAVAPGFTLPLPGPAYAWVAVSAEKPSWREKLVENAPLIIASAAVGALTTAALIAFPGFAQAFKPG